MSRRIQFSLKLLTLFSILCLAAILFGWTLRNQNVQRLQSEVDALRKSAKQNDKKVQVLKKRLNLNVNQAWFNSRNDRSVFLPVDNSPFGQPVPWSWASKPVKSEPGSYLMYRRFTPTRTWQPVTRLPFNDTLSVEQGMMMDAIEQKQKYRELLEN